MISQSGVGGESGRRRVSLTTTTGYLAAAREVKNLVQLDQQWVVNFLEHLSSTTSPFPVRGKWYEQH